MIRLHLKGQKPARVLTSVKLFNAERFWNPKPEWKKWIVKHPDKEAINAEIESEFNRIKKQVEDWQRAEPDTLFTPALLTERIRNGVSEYYFDWINIVLEDAKEQAYATYLGKKGAANLFRAFTGDDIQLKSVSPVLVRQFQDYLKKKPTSSKGKRKGSSLNKVIARLDILHQAVLIKTGHSPKRAKILSPWTDVVSVEEVKPKKAKLTEETIQHVAALTIETPRKRSFTHADAFRIWQLSMTLAGARFSDVIKLRYCEFQTDDEGQPVHLRYEMQKTGNSVSVPIFDEARQILNYYWKPNAKQTDYVLPFLKNTEAYAKLITYEQYRNANFPTKQKYFEHLDYWNSKTNHCLKDIQEKAGLKEKLTAIHQGTASQTWPGELWKLIKL